MKLQNLTDTEIQQINGGSSANASSASMSFTFGADSLFGMNFNWSDGNGHSYQSSLQIGKDVHLGIGGITAGSQQ